MFFLYIIFFKSFNHINNRVSGIASCVGPLTERTFVRDARM